MDLQKDLPLQQKPITRKYSIEKVGPFHLFTLEGRVDAFNFDDVQEALMKLAGKHAQGLAVNLEKAEFLSIPFIKLLAEVADKVRAQGTRLALVAPTEKIKRQIDIFASLDDMIIYRSRRHLEA